MSLHFSLMCHFRINDQMEHIILWKYRVSIPSLFMFSQIVYYLPPYNFVFFQVVKFNKNLILGNFQYFEM